VLAAPLAMPAAMPAPAPLPALAPPPSAPAVAAAPAAVEEKAHVVTSPFVGTFYRKPNPDSPAYVALNDRVEKGQVLCIVEAMKLMNEIESDAAGTVIGILVEDGAPVEYGQALFKIAT
jgi:acetyl-CoA carboxylase biotin carboxyl carrier protein